MTQDRLIALLQPLMPRLKAWIERAWDPSSVPAHFKLIVRVAPGNRRPMRVHARAEGSGGATGRPTTRSRGPFSVAPRRESQSRDPHGPASGRAGVRGQSLRRGEEGEAPTKLVEAGAGARGARGDGEGADVSPGLVLARVPIDGRETVDLTDVLGAIQREDLSERALRLALLARVRAVGRKTRFISGDP